MHQLWSQAATRNVDMVTSTNGSAIVPFRCLPPDDVDGALTALDTPLYVYGDPSNPSWSPSPNPNAILNPLGFYIALSLSAITGELEELSPQIVRELIPQQS